MGKVTQVMKRELRVTDADYLNFECKIGKPLKLKILPFTSNLPAILKIPKLVWAVHIYDPNVTFERCWFVAYHLPQKHQIDYLQAYAMLF